MSRYIDADELVKRLGLDKARKYGNESAEQQAFSYSTMMMYEIADMIEDSPTVELPQWIPCSERMPECEEEVMITYYREYRGEKHYSITTAIYEDGTMYTEDSCWCWYEHDFKLDEEKDDYIISEGWWEDKHFNEDDEYNHPVDCKVIAWMPLPTPYKKVRTNDECR